MRQNGYRDLKACKFGLCKRLEARILKGGLVSIGRDISDQRLVRNNRADTAAQSTVKRQRHNGGAHGLKWPHKALPFNVWCTAMLNADAYGSARHIDQLLTLGISQLAYSKAQAP